MPATAPRFRLPLIAILRGITPAEVEAHGGALVEAGFDAIEVPLNSPDAHESIARLQQAFGQHASIGAGTVLRETEVDALAARGVRFIVTPNTRPALIRHAVAAGMQVVAGFATPSEAFDALQAGAQALKLFPAGTYGPAHARALRAVLPDVPLYAVGGISPDALPAWLAAGCTGAGLGGELYKAGQPAEVTRACARAFRQAYEGAVA